MLDYKFKRFIFNLKINGEALITFLSKLALYINP